MPVTASQVLLAGAIDLAIGDPRWLPHPVRIIGRAISGCERGLRKACSTPSGERLAGVILVLIIVLPVYVLAAYVSNQLNRSAELGYLFSTVLIATTIAAHELIFSVKRVVDVSAVNVEAGRQAVSMIVGRDTKDLDERGVLRAAIETLAENLSDGVVAPLFYLAIGGLPFAFAYKAINTLDSMVGYKNDRYRYFGWASARLDDAVNYVPARITGVLIIAAFFLYAVVKRTGEVFPATRRAFSIMLRDGRNHPSPNSGVPEAAMAGALAIQLGGPSVYGGFLVEKPTIGDAETVDYRSAARIALQLATTTSIAAIALTSGAAALRSLW